MTLSSVRLAPHDLSAPTAAQLEAIVGEMYAAHHVLRCFGLLPDEIFVGVQLVTNLPAGGHYALVQVKSHGQEATLCLQPVPPDWEPAILAAWKRFVSELPEVSEARLEAMVSRSAIRWRAVEVAAVLASKGLLSASDPLPEELN